MLRIIGLLDVWIVRVCCDVVFVCCCGCELDGVWVGKSVCVGVLVAVLLW